MKRASIILNIITLSALGIIFLKSCPPPKKPNPENQEQGCPTCYPMNCDTSYHPVKANFVIDLIKNYRDNQWKAINTEAANGHIRIGNNNMDSRSVWFSIQRIKRFIYEIESKVCATCSDTTKHLGIRLYYGQYDLPVAGSTNFYDGLHTVIMIPTMQDANGDNVDFDPEYISEKCTPIVPDCSAPEIMALLPNVTMNAMNHGTISPPPPVPPSTSIDVCTPLMNCIDQMFPFSASLNGPQSIADTLKK